MHASLSADIELVSALSAQDRYDYIVVGSGMGGGVVTRKLVEGGQRVLLVEKGDLLFTTHCLNTSRPHWPNGSLQGPSQDNDVVYNTVKQKVQTATGSDPYVGGPVYCLGGRSTVWGLFAPKISDATREHFFPERISEFLPGKYKEAFCLMSNGSQENGDIYPAAVDISAEKKVAIEKLQNAIEDLYESCNDERPENSNKPTVSLAPIAAEFQSQKQYQFPQGAYSTVDALLDMAYGRDPNLTLLMNTEVIYLGYKKLPQPDKTDNFNLKYVAHSMTVRSTASQRQEIKLHAKKGIILCAGTIETARIALNSGLQNTHPLVGKGLTDHEIWGVRFMKEKRAVDDPKNPLKLQSEIHICDREALLNVVVNANTLFGCNCAIFTPPTQSITPKGQLDKEIPPILQRGDPPEESPDYDTMNITLEFGSELCESNKVLECTTRDPTVHIARPTAFSGEKFQKEMQNLATMIRNHILEELPEPAPRLSLAGFGVVAHEVGTMRLKSPKYDDYVVDEKCRVRDFSNLYVCDLSIFPVSPPANPSLTLVALALQLASDLLNTNAENETQEEKCVVPDSALGSSPTWDRSRL